MHLELAATLRKVPRGLALRREAIAQQVHALLVQGCQRFGHVEPATALLERLELAAPAPELALRVGERALGSLAPLARIGGEQRVVAQVPLLLGQCLAPRYELPGALDAGEPLLLRRQLRTACGQSVALRVRIIQRALLLVPGFGP